MDDGQVRIDTPSPALACFAAQLRYEDIPESVRDRALDLFVDWAGSALARAPARVVRTIATFARTMGPQTGPSEVLVDGTRTSPYFATMANAAASHVTEQDDSSVFQPATFVFSPALAVAQAVGASGHDLLTASVAGYEVGIRIGELLSRSHYKIFHTSGTAGAVAAAGATGRLLNLTPRQMLHAIESASSEAAGLCEFLGDAADSKQLHTAHAAAAGLASAYVAKDGFTAEKHATEYIGAGKLRAAKPDKVTDSLRQRWATAETSFKYHASYRHTLPPAGTPLRTSRDEITAKVRSLIGFSGRTDAEALVARLWRIGELNRVAGIAS